MGRPLEEEEIRIGVYSVSPEVMDWLSHNFVAMTCEGWDHFKGIGYLVNIVDRVEAEALPRNAAKSAIRDYNEDHGTRLIYEEIRDRDESFIASHTGGWVAYLESGNDCRSIMSSEHDNAEAAFIDAHADIEWVLVWLVQDNEILVYRSPWVGRRKPAEDSIWLAEGEEKGDYPSYVLPPEIEAAMWTCDPHEILDGSQNITTLNRQKPGGGNARFS